MHGVDQSSAVGRQNYVSNRCRDTLIAQFGRSIRW
jgi:hypothetical protein